MATATDIQLDPHRVSRIALRAVESSYPQRPRSLREFAEQEVVIPTGQYRGMPFRCSRQPLTGILFDEIDSGAWVMHVITGPSQSAKSLCGYAIPAIRTIAEYREDCGMFCPEADLHAHKFAKDILPVLKASPRLRQFIPESGAGSKGGKVKDAINFPHGPSMLLFSAGGQDTNKAAVTLRWMICTEAAGLSRKSETTKEGGLLRQLRARLKGYPRDQHRIIVEGTVTVAEDYPWCLKGDEESEQLISSRSRLVVPCPHCEAWISPEREHLVGWQDAKNESEAGNEAFWCCPECGEEITECQRKKANADVRIVHHGQEITRDGTIIGDRPPVSTLWFRWTQFNNLLVPAGDAAVEEWIAAQMAPGSQEHTDAEKALCQFTHCLPAEPEEFDVVDLSFEQASKRVTKLPRGAIPPGAIYLSCGVDVRQTQLHYVVIAWMPDGRGHVVNCGVIDVDSEHLGIRTAILAALRHLRDNVLPRAAQDSEGRFHLPAWSVVDGGWKTEVIRAFCAEQPRKWLMIFGRGQSEPPGKGSYQHPTALSKTIQWIGENCYINYQEKYLQRAMFANSDEWKTYVHEAIAMPADQPGALTFWMPNTADERQLHRMWMAGIVAECAVRKQVPRRGSVIVWVNKGRRQNHPLDTTYYGCVGGHLCGVRVATLTPKTVVPEPPTKEPLTMPDGRPYMAVSTGEDL